MHKPRYILRVALGVLLIGMAYAVAVLRQPLYEGKSVQWWFNKFCSLHPNFPVTFASENYADRERVSITALRSLRQESAPYLITVLRRRDTHVTRVYNGLWKMLPKNLQQGVPAPVDISWLHWNAARALAGLGTNAQPAIPDLLELWDLRKAWTIENWVIRVLRNSELTSQELDAIIEQLVNRRNDLEVLSVVESLRRSSPQISKALALILQRGDAVERQRAAAILAKGDSYPSITLDSLRKALTDSEPEVRYAAVRAIESLGAEGLSAKPELEKAVSDENTMVRTVANRILEGRNRAAN